MNPSFDFQAPNGSGETRQHCHYCDPDHKKSETFCINHDKGVYFCQRCHASGGLNNPSELTPEQKRALENKRSQAERERDARAQQAALAAQKEWGTLSDTGISAYLERKGVNAHGVKFAPDYIAIPARGPGHDLRGLQRIYENGDKRFTKGSRKRGAHHLIEGAADSPIVICEGYATGASVREATGYSVAIAFDAGNLEPVTSGLKAVYPDRRLIIAADNDQWTPGNPGATKATDAAQRHHADVAIVDFEGLDTSTKPTDFNDLHALVGLDAVRRQIEHAKPVESEMPQDDSTRNRHDAGAHISRLPTEAQSQADEIRKALGHINKDASLDGAKHSASQTIGYALCTEYGGSPAQALGQALCVEWDTRTGGCSARTYQAADPNYQGPTGPVTTASLFKLARQCGWTGKPTVQWSDPEPLPEARPPVAAFDPALLPECLRDWIMDISERMQCPPDFPAIGAMVALVSLVGRKIGIRPKRHDDWLEVPNLWGAVIGRPGMLKTPALAEAMRPLHRLAAQARETHEHDVQSWEAEKLKLELDAKALKKDAAKVAGSKSQNSRDRLDAIVHELHKLQAEEDAGPPPERRYMTNDSTVEKLGELLAANPNGLLVFRDELTGWLRQLDKDGQESSRAFYLESWSGKGSFTFDRIGRGTLHIDSACVSILGGIQPGPLVDYVTAANGQGRGADGLLQRFQMTVWPDDPGQWKNVDRWPEKESRNRAFGVFELLDNLIPTAIGAQQDEPGDIPYLRFSASAQALFDEWRTDLEHRLRGDLPEAVESHLAKYRKLCPALALLIHLADGHSGSVSESAMIKAGAWCEYLESHAMRVYAAAMQSEITAAHDLAAKIKAGALPTPFKPKDVYDKQWRGLSREQTQKAIATLDDYQWLRIETIDTGGRPSKICHINPKLRGAA